MLSDTVCPCAPPTPMVKNLAGLLSLVALILASVPLHAQAPLRPDPLIEPIVQENPATSWNGQAPVYYGTVQSGAAQIGWTALGSAAGIGVGALAGMAAASGQGFPGDVILGGLVGFAVGTVAAPVGAHLANGRRGNLPLGIAATVGATGGYWLLMTQVPGIRGYAALGIPLVAIGVPTAVEIGTSR